MFLTERSRTKGALFLYGGLSLNSLNVPVCGIAITWQICVLCMLAFGWINCNKIILIFQRILIQVYGSDRTLAKMSMDLMMENNAITRLIVNRWRQG